MEIFEKMSQQDVASDVITYNALISACEKGNQPERALENFQKMQQQDLVRFGSSKKRLESSKSLEFFCLTFDSEQILTFLSKLFGTPHEQTLAFVHSREALGAGCPRESRESLQL